MMAAHTGLADSRKPLPYFESSEIIVFRYDVRMERFSRVSGRQQAFLGYSRSDWLAPTFLEDALEGTDRTSVPRALADCRTEQRIVRGCRFLDAKGTQVSGLIAGVPLDSDADQIVGQIVTMDTRSSLIGRPLIRQVIDPDLMRALVTLLGQLSGTMSSFSDMMTRHLGAQGDDLGGEYALGIREAIASLDASLARLRPADRRRADDRRCC